MPKCKLIEKTFCLFFSFLMSVTCAPSSAKAQDPKSSNLAISFPTDQLKLDYYLNLDFNTLNKTDIANDILEELTSFIVSTLEEKIEDKSFFAENNRPLKDQKGVLIHFLNDYLDYLRTGISANNTSFSELIDSFLKQKFKGIDRDQTIRLVRFLVKKLYSEITTFNLADGASLLDEEAIFYDQFIDMLTLKLYRTDTSTPFENAIKNAIRQSDPMFQGVAILFNRISIKSIPSSDVLRHSYLIDIDFKSSRGDKLQQHGFKLVIHSYRKFDTNRDYNFYGNEKNDRTEKLYNRVHRLVVGTNNSDTSFKYDNAAYEFDVVEFVPGNNLFEEVHQIAKSSGATTQLVENISNKIEKVLKSVLREQFLYQYKTADSSQGYLTNFEPNNIKIYQNEIRFVKLRVDQDLNFQNWYNDLLLNLVLPTIFSFKLEFQRAVIHKVFHDIDFYNLIKEILDEIQTEILESQIKEPQKESVMATLHNEHIKAFFDKMKEGILKHKRNVTDQTTLESVQFKIFDLLREPLSISEKQFEASNKKTKDIVEAKSREGEYLIPKSYFRKYLKEDLGLKMKEVPRSLVEQLGFNIYKFYNSLLSTEKDRYQPRVSKLSESFYQVFRLRNLIMPSKYDLWKSQIKQALRQDQFHFRTLLEYLGLISPQFIEYIGEKKKIKRVVMASDGLLLYEGIKEIHRNEQGLLKDEGDLEEPILFYDTRSLITRKIKKLVMDLKSDYGLLVSERFPYDSLEKFIEFRNDLLGQIIIDFFEKGQEGEIQKELDEITTQIDKYINSHHLESYDEIHFLGVNKSEYFALFFEAYIRWKYQNGIATKINTFYSDYFQNDLGFNKKQVGALDTSFIKYDIPDLQENVNFQSPVNIRFYNLIDKKRYFFRLANLYQVFRAPVTFLKNNLDRVALQYSEENSKNTLGIKRLKVNEKDIIKLAETIQTATTADGKVVRFKNPETEEEFDLVSGIVNSDTWHGKFHREGDKLIHHLRILWDVLHNLKDYKRFIPEKFYDSWHDLAVLLTKKQELFEYYVLLHDLGKIYRRAPSLGNVQFKNEKISYQKRDHERAGAIGVKGGKYIYSKRVIDPNTKEVKFINIEYDEFPGLSLPDHLDKRTLLVMIEFHGRAYRYFENHDEETYKKNYEQLIQDMMASDIVDEPVSRKEAIYITKMIAAAGLMDKLSSFRKDLEADFDPVKGGTAVVNIDAINNFYRIVKLFEEEGGEKVYNSESKVFEEQNLEVFEASFNKAA